MRRCLGAVDHHRNIVAVSNLNDSPDGIYRAQSIRNVDYRYEFRSLVQKLFELFEDQLAVVVDGRHAKMRAFLVTKHLPGNYVRVMFHSGDDDFIARLHICAAIAVRYEVDGLGRPSNEDDFLR